MQKRLRLFFVIVLSLTSVLSGCRRSYQTSELNIIPIPAFMVQKSGSFTLSSTTNLELENLGQNSPTAKYISTTLRKMHFVPTFSGNHTDGGILLKVNDSLNSEIGLEGYLLEVTTSGVVISANTEAGLFYGFQTLLQMLPPDIHKTTYRSIVIPECTILDNPRFEWRGCELDVCRHFFSVKEIKRVLDVMAFYKMNKFIWHLADDYAWRIESQHFPMLNEIGSWRVDRGETPWDQIESARPEEKSTYGGFYTKSEIREVIDYAASLHIEVIPEVDLPNNATALLASYPSFSCNRAERVVPCGTSWTGNTAVCLGDDSVVARTIRLIDEVVDLFDSPYIHLGCDEIGAGTWEDCPRCQYRIRSNKLGDPSHLQSWFITLLAEHLGTKDKSVLAWDALMNESLPPSVGIMSWSSLAAGMDAARMGHDVIMCMSDYCSLDYYQADSRYHPVAMPGLLELRKAYEFDPVPAGTNFHLLPRIKGGQCMLWTENIHGAEQLEYMLLPRLCAISESLWSPRNVKDWREFRYRIEPHKKYFSAHGYNYCPGSFKPVMTKTSLGNGRYEMRLESEVLNTYIFFTTDGSEPTQSSQIYIAPVPVEAGTVVKTISVYDGQQQEGVYEYHL